MAELLAKEENRTRSELFREALRQYIERRHWQQIRGWGKKSANEFGIGENDIENIVNESRRG
jgi:CopG family transcriptional regulator/antitoxin EndoAI